MTKKSAGKRAEESYLKYKEEVMKHKFPYEYALLESDLRENLKAMYPDFKGRKDTAVEYSIGPESLRRAINSDTNWAHPLDFDEPPLKKIIKECHETAEKVIDNLPKTITWQEQLAQIEKLKEKKS